MSVDELMRLYLKLKSSKNELQDYEQFVLDALELQIYALRQTAFLQAKQAEAMIADLEAKTRRVQPVTANNVVDEKTKAAGN